MTQKKMILLITALLHKILYTSGKHASSDLAVAADSTHTKTLFLMQYFTIK